MGYGRARCLSTKFLFAPPTHGTSLDSKRSPQASSAQRVRIMGM